MKTREFIHAKTLNPFPKRHREETSKDVSETRTVIEKLTAIE